MRRKANGDLEGAEEAEDRERGSERRRTEGLQEAGTLRAGAALGYGAPAALSQRGGGRGGGGGGGGCLRLEKQEEDWVGLRERGRVRLSKLCLF